MTTGEIDPLPFTVLTREARASGISTTILHGPEFTSVRRGVRVPVGVDATHPDVRIAAVAAQLPGHATIGGWAAARLHERAAGADDLEVFDGGRRWEEHDARRAPGANGVARVLVCAPRESRLRWRPDVRVFRSTVPDEERVILGGVPVTSPLRTAFDLARLLPTHQAVVGVDRLLHLGLVDAEALAALVHRCVGHVGRPGAARVVALTDAGAESPQESLLRLAWLSSGLPRPRANQVVLDAAGRFVARVDLIDDHAGVVGEYDGAMHAGAARRSDDARRQEELEDLGLVVVRATAIDIDRHGRGGAWQQRLRAAYRRAAARGPGRRRWRLKDT